MDNDNTRQNSSTFANAVIDEMTKDNIKRYAENGKEAIDQRIKELEQKWDIDRTFEMNAAMIILGGAFLSIVGGRKWLLVSGVATLFLAQHALKRRGPLLALYRSLGVRTRQELEREKYALKAIRGDFNNIADDLEKVWNAVKSSENRDRIGFRPEGPEVWNKGNAQAGKTS